jgi:hypothetical protein
MFPPDRFLQVDHKQDGGFEVKRASSYLKALMSDIGKVYYIRDCLLAIAATMCREFSVSSGTAIPTPTDTLRVIIHRRIEAVCKGIKLPTKRDNTKEYLFLTVALLSEFVGYLFNGILTIRHIPNETANNALKSMHRHNVSLLPEDITTPLQFGHLLTVALMQTTDIAVASKYSNPILNPKVNGLSNESLVVERIKNLHSNFYAHATGYIWDTRILFILRKKAHIHLKHFINDALYTDLKLFETYSIFDDIPNTFVKCAQDPNDFTHSISVTTDIQEVISLTLNSPCRTLGGSVVDHTVNSM